MRPGFVNASGKVSSDGRSIIIGGSRFHMVEGAAASLVGLSENIVATINAINSGNDLNQAGTGLDLSGYKALTATTAMLLFDQTTGVEKTTLPEIPLYVPNLLMDLVPYRFCSTTTLPVNGRSSRQPWILQRRK